MSPFARFEMLCDLYATPVFDDDGEFLYSSPTGLISREKFLELLDSPVARTSGSTPPTPAPEETGPASR